MVYRILDINSDGSLERDEVLDVIKDIIGNNGKILLDCSKMFKIFANSDG